MQEDFMPSLGMVLTHEGGFVDNPHDPGGATNRGITQLVYDNWRAGQGLPKRSVEFINAYETGKIYKTQYWDTIRGDELPAGVDYCVFDFAINSGVSRAIRYLQMACEAAVDGHLGPATLAAVKALDPIGLIDRICLHRLEFLQQLTTFDEFGKGWTNRVNEVKEQAHDMVEK